MIITNVQDLSWFEIIGGALIGVPTFYLFIKKVLVKSAVDDATINAAGLTINATQTQANVIKMLRVEVVRLSSINSQMSQILTQIQQENGKLRTEVSDLTSVVYVMEQKLKVVSQRKEDVPYVGEERRDG